IGGVNRFIKFSVHQERVDMILGKELLQTKSQLPNIVHALGLSCLSHSPTENWKQKGCENGDDGDYSHQLDQSKTIAFFLSHINSTFIWRRGHDYSRLTTEIYDSRRE